MLNNLYIEYHDYSQVQQEATLEVEITNVQIRSNKLNNETITWPESLADDYLHQSSDDEFETSAFMT